MLYDQCDRCACHYVNWDKEMMDDMEKVAPGVDCTQELNPPSKGVCIGFCPVDEEIK